MKLSRRSFFCSAVAAGLMSSSATHAQQRSQTSGEMPVENYDCVVLGAGPAGLITAISAHDAGAKVVVLEKCDRPNGNSIYSMGAIAAWGTNFQNRNGIKDNRDDFYNTMMKVTVNRADPELVATYTDNISAGVNWLEDEMKVPFGRILNFQWPILRRACQVAEQGMTGGGTLVQTLLQRVKERGIPVRYEHKAIELVTGPDGSVKGVIAQTPTQKILFNGKGGVAICTGGFSANQELTGMYIGEWASRLSLRGSHSVTGENITLTRPLYAKLVNMSHFHAGPIVSATHTNPASVLSCGYGIIINNSGDRFLDEKDTYVEKAKQCAQRTPDNMGWVIMDNQWAGLEKQVAKYTAMNSPFHKAESLEELAKKLGVDPTKLQKVVSEYNTAVKAQKTKELTPPCTLNNPKPIIGTKFYAFPFEGGMTATYGGPKINSRTQVVNLENKVIPGLHAVGNSAGGLFYKDYLGGSQLGACTVFGRIAGREMAAKAKSQN